jgi:hypothetical protein
MAKTVTITNATVDRLMANSAVKSNLSCIANAPVVTTRKRSCGKCGSKTTSTPEYDRVKKCLGALNGDSLTYLKTFLKADTIKISYTLSKGGSVTKYM